MAKYLAPAPKFQAFDSDGAPLVGGFVYTYATGGNTPLATYTDSTGNTANANPVVLDSRGEASIWFTPGVEYRITVTDADGGAIYGPIDNVAGAVTPSAYFATLMTATQRSTLFDAIAAPGGTVTGTILMSGAAVNFAAGVTVPSATSTPIGAAASNNITVSGVATITSFDNVTAGIVRYVTFSGVLTLTHNATSLILPGGANITTAAGDTAAFQSLGSGNWRCLFYQKADGTALAGNTAAASQAEMEAATSTTVMVTPGRTQYHPGVAKAWLVYNGSSGSILASSNVASVTKNGTGDYTINFTTAFSSANYTVVGTCGYSANAGAFLSVNRFSTATPLQTTSARIECNVPGSRVDPEVVCVSCFGDQ